MRGGMTLASVDAVTLNGLLDLVTPEPATINAAAIAHGLAQINRWAGAVETPISVAQHSVLVYDIFRILYPDLKPHAVFALLHDGHEYALGDLYGPFETLLASRIPGFGAHVAACKGHLDFAIRRALDLPEPTIEMLAAVHEADMVAADLEWKLRMPAANGESPFARFAARHPTIRKPALRAMSWVEAADLFRSTLSREMGERRWEVAA